MKFLELLWSALEDVAGDTPGAGPRLQVIGPAPDVTVQAPPRYAWDEKGWEQFSQGHDVHYSGRYRVYDYRQGKWRAFDGRLVQSGARITAYCADPPVEIKGHPKGPCFMLTQSPWFRIHWRRQPGSVDEALIYVERLLDECLNQGRR